MPLPRLQKSKIKEISKTKEIIGGLGHEKHMNGKILCMNHATYTKKMSIVKNFFVQSGGIEQRK